MTVTGGAAQFQMDFIELIAAREVSATVDAVVPNLVRIIQMHGKSVVQIEFFTTQFTVGNNVLRTNVILTDHIFTGVRISEGCVNGVIICNVMLQITFVLRVIVT